MGRNYMIEGLKLGEFVEGTATLDGMRLSNLENFGSLVLVWCVRECGFGRVEVEMKVRGSTVEV